MPRSTRTRLALVALAFAGLLSAAALAGRLGNVILKDGTRLRGDITESPTEIIIRNSAGEVRYPRDKVARIEYLAGPLPIEQDYEERRRVLAPSDVDGHYALAEWCRERRRYDLVKRQCEHILGLKPDHRSAALLLGEAEQKLSESGPDAQGEKPIAAAPLMHERDINRLRLAEMRFGEGAEPGRVQVRFLRKRGEPELEDLVRRELRERGERNPDFEQTLQSGRPMEKLQVILEATGLKFADRIEIRGDTEPFETFRRRVLPHIVQNCARAGCHSGAAARAVRFPGGANTSDGYAYAVFALLDRMDASYAINTVDQRDASVARPHRAPLISRELPETSLLLDYMLPTSVAGRSHPAVKRGRVTPAFSGLRDPDYETVVKWINMLRVPRPEYGLEYKFPEWAIPNGDEAAASGPTSRPDDDGAEPPARPDPATTRPATPARTP